MSNGISTILIQWYEAHHRKLPWRETTDPYRIWISEIILQQTRVLQGLEYYTRFVDRFPNVESLARAHEDEVMKLWQGLGYYSRARNLHAAAREVCEKYGGVFPADYACVRALKGIGDYTASAICSIAFGLPHATVDGNVYRVLARLFGLDTPIDTPAGRGTFTTLAGSLLDPTRAGVHNQAMMEFGALQCVPHSPNCAECPLLGQCVAFKEGRVDELPVKAGRTIVKPRYFNYLHLRHRGHTLLVKRTGNDIWRNLYEFPLLETPTPVELDALCEDPRFQTLLGGTQYTVLHCVTMPQYRLSHRIIHACFYEIEVEAFPRSLPLEACVVADNKVSDYAVSRLTELYLNRMERTVVEQ